jgi:hypothetical protein
MQTNFKIIWTVAILDPHEEQQTGRRRLKYAQLVQKQLMQMNFKIIWTVVILDPHAE